MNAMAFAGMMSMFASYMGMNMGNMGNAMRNMGMNQMGNMGGAMANMGSNQMSGHNYGVGDLSSSNSGGHEPKNYSGGNVNPSNQNTSMGDMSGYANTMGAMFGVDPANVQAALYNAYGTGGGYNQLGVYNNQSSSAYGPARSTSTGNAAGTASQGYKPY
jgi:hypothetical protein